VVTFSGFSKPAPHTNSSPMSVMIAVELLPHDARRACLEPRPSTGVEQISLHQIERHSVEKLNAAYNAPRRGAQ